MFIKNQYQEICRCVEVPGSCAHCLEVFFGKDGGSEFTENRNVSCKKKLEFIKKYV